MLTRMLQRRGTSVQWDDVKDTLILASGEIGIIVDETVNSGKFKIGDGKTLWKDLDFYYRDDHSEAKYAQLNIPTQTLIGSNVFTPNEQIVVPLVVSAHPSQSANLQVWKNSSDVVLASVNKDGDLSVKKATFNGVINANSNKVTNVATPEDGGDATNKAYVDAAINGLAWKTPVNLVSTSDYDLTGTFPGVSIDGHPITATQVGYRILLTAQDPGTENGIYVITEPTSGNYELVRAEDADTYQELIGASVYVEEGTVYKTSSWVQSSHYITSFANQTWVKFNGASETTAGDGLTASGNVFNVGAGTGITVNADNVQISDSYIGQESINTLKGSGDGITTGLWRASTIDTDKGGTGITSYSVGDILYASSTSGTTQLSKLSAGSESYILKSGGPSAAPSWGQIVTASIADSSGTTSGVTYAKMQHVSNENKILGRISSGSGIIEELSADNLITILNTSLSTISYNRLPIGTTANTVAAGDHTHTLDNLSDVALIGTPIERQILKFDGENWINELPSGGISVGPSAPANAVQGDAWFDSTDGSLYVRYDDSVGSVTYDPGDVTIRTVTHGNGYSTNLQLSWIRDDENSRYVLGYAYKLYATTSFFTNTSLSGELVINGSTVWQPSGTYSISSNSNITLSSGTIYMAYTTPSLVLTTSASLQTVIQGVGYAVLPATITYSKTLISMSGSSAQWVQVKANSALEASILTRLSAVETRETVLEQANPIRVLSAAERDAKFPSPVQGNMVFRADLGHYEKYFAAYNAQTTPDGTNGTVGWYTYDYGVVGSTVPQVNGTVTQADTDKTVVRNITLSTSAPSGGNDGDIWMVYV